jgi:hypothetical protein
LRLNVVSTTASTTITEAIVTLVIVVIGMAAFAHDMPPDHIPGPRSHG